MNADEAKAVRLVDQGHTVANAASLAGVSANEVVKAVAERDRRRGNHQTREPAQ